TGEQVTASSKHFPYRLEHLSGVIEQNASAAGEPNTKVNLVGFAGAQPVRIRGEVTGDYANAAMAIDIWGDNIPLDKKLLEALPGKYQELARSFSPSGLGNFQAYLRRSPQAHQWSNRFIVAFHDATLRYKEFSYPLEEVTGILDIQPDHWEFRDF